MYLKVMDLSPWDDNSSAVYRLSPPSAIFLSLFLLIRLYPQTWMKAAMMPTLMKPSSNECPRMYRGPSLAR